jgi:hypothetical protein
MTPRLDARIASLAATFLVGAVALGGCSAGSTPMPTRPPGTSDGGVADDLGGLPSGECETFMDCAPGLVCRAVGTTLRCVSPDLVVPPTETCTACAPPAECRLGVCIAPDDTGAVCEFDAECPAGELCIAARCTPDPRVPIACADGMCPGTLRCVEGTCACDEHVDCPVGTLCIEGRCTPSPGGDGCVADDECPATDVCEAGSCRPRTLCDITNPDLSGTWSLASTLRLRESLPSWLDGFLGAVSGPFRFIAGDSSTLGVPGLPGWVEALIAPALRDWADANLAPWVRDLLGGIADLNDILSTWQIDERMELRPGILRDLYKGTHTWLSTRFEFRGAEVRGRPEDILDWRFRASEFDAAASCGAFVIERHDVDVSIGAIIAWIVDTVTYEATDGRYRTFRDALTAATSGFCGEVGRIAGETVPSYPGLAGTVSRACDGAVASLITELDDTIRSGRLGLDVMTLKGYAPIAGPNALRPGVWEGTLVGRDFTGDFDAFR